MSGSAVIILRPGRGLSRALSLALQVILFFPGTLLLAQGQLAGSIPDAPLPESGTEAYVPQATETPGSIFGLVTDRDGALIAGAQISVTTGGRTRSLHSESDGRFSLEGLPPGDFTATISATGQITATRKGTLRDGARLDLGPIALDPAGARADVQVNATTEELAEAELKAEETQRIGGFIPNFYVVYDWNAAPLSSRQKYHLALRTLVDPVTFLLNGVSAGIEQAQDTFPGYGQGAAGYGRRFGANYGDIVAGTMLGGALLPQLFHQDPRYFYKGTGTIKRRLGYALATSVICRGDNGRWQFAYASILGDFSAAAISNAYYPATDRHGAALTIEQSLLNIGLDGVQNMIQEFLLRHLTPHPPTYSSTVSAPSAESN